MFVVCRKSTHRDFWSLNNFFSDTAKENTDASLQRLPGTRGVGGGHVRSAVRRATLSRATRAVSYQKGHADIWTNLRSRLPLQFVSLSFFRGWLSIFGSLGYRDCTVQLSQWQCAVARSPPMPSARGLCALLGAAATSDRAPQEFGRISAEGTESWMHSYGVIESSQVGVYRVRRLGLQACSRHFGE